MEWGSAADGVALLNRDSEGSGTLLQLYPVNFHGSALPRDDVAEGLLDIFILPQPACAAMKNR
jgi:hypothetical protein